MFVTNDVLVIIVAYGSSGGLQTLPTKTPFADNYVTLGRDIAVESPNIQFSRSDCTSKE